MSEKFDTLEALKLLAQNQETLTQLLALREGQKQVGTVHSAITLHGAGGIFSTCGLEREVITAHIEPHGIAEVLPLFPSIDTDPRYATLTGFTQAYGAQPTHACEPAPSGYMKGCNLTAKFGLIRFDTNTIEFDTVMRRFNRGDFLDLALLGGLWQDQDVTKGVVPGNLDPNQVLNIITMAEMVGAGVQAQREITRQNWQGIVALGEYPGLDSQIATGQMDADTAVLCPALDSDVKDFAYDDVCGTGRDIVEYMSMMAWYLAFNARRMKLAPVQWVVVMRPELWYELSACWPCRYFSNRCQDAAGTQIAIVNDDKNPNTRDGMRKSLTIPINGMDYPVILDDGIFEHDSTNNANLNGGEFASSIYFVPLTITGGFPVTYRQYLNYKHPIADANVATFAGMRRPDFWTDRGVFSWAYDGELWCYLLALKTEQRVVLRTPQLAGKIQHVRYTPLQHLRSPFPSSEYFMDGGVSVRPTGVRYAVWAPGGTSR
jgi:hypothetical protein